jgi:hypothetical protein
LTNHSTHAENRLSPATEDARDLRPEAARKRLQECESQGEACEVVREIVSNLLGCEEMAVFELDAKNKRPSLVWSFGVEPKSIHFPELCPDARFSRLLSGHTCVNECSVGCEDFKHKRAASACVPILFEGRTAGVLLLVRLLPQKSNIDELDHGLLAVVSKEAGRPLFGHRACNSGRSERKR